MSWRTKVILRWVLFLGWIGFAFFLSRQPASESGQLSDNVANFLAALSRKLGFTPDSSFGSRLRDYAHFSLHLVLAFFSYQAISTTTKRFKVVVAVSLAISVAIATIDEFVQFIAPGRAFEVPDLMLNYSGVMLGVIISLLVTKEPELKLM